jgi:allantoin racemase
LHTFCFTVTLLVEILMRLLIVNPNMTVRVTERVVAEAQRCRREGTEITGVTAGFGVAIVSTEAELAIAAHAALDLLATHAAGHDAAIVAMSFDAGVVAARRLLPMPVIGITEAALHTACLLGRRFGMVVAGAVSVPLYLDLLQASGLAGRMAGMEVAEIASVAGYLDAELVEAQILAAAQRLAGRPEIEAIVLCGAAIAGLAHRLQPGLSVPLIDGVAAAVGQAEMQIQLNLRPRARPKALADGLPAIGLGDHLAQLLQGAALPPPSRINPVSRSKLP